MADKGSDGGVKQAVDPAAVQHSELQFSEGSVDEPLKDTLGDSLADPLTVQQTPSGDPGTPGGDPSSPTQFSGSGASAVRSAAAKGISGSGGSLPFASQIQSSFGGHDVSSVQAHTGGAASAANKAMGSNAFATGNHVAFKGAPDLHTAAHEAAHVVQQRAGVNLPGGVGKAGDSYEQHADTVADAVVQGKSAAPLLDQFTGGNAAGAAAVQRDVQMSFLGDLASGAADLAGRAVNAGAEMVSNAIQAVVQWIDLMGAKTRLLGKIMDTAWVDAATSGIKSNPHPKHAGMFNLSLQLVLLKARADAWSHAGQIAGCDTMKDVQALEKKVDVWRSKRGVTLKKEFEGKIKEYADVEKKWMTKYTSTAAMEQKSVKPNQSTGAVADIKLQPGMTSKVSLTSRVKVTWKHTKEAKAKNLHKTKPWKAAEKTAFLTEIQKQLDAVWGAGNQMKPFKIIQPEDHLLDKSAQKWSAVQGTFHPIVQRDDKNGTTEINAWRSAPKEGTRADSGNLYEGDMRKAADYKANKDGTHAPQKMKEKQMVMAHEFGHFGMGLPDEYNETAKIAEGVAEKDRSQWQKDTREGFFKVIKDYEKKIADAKKQIAANPNKTDADKTAKADWERKLKWWDHDRKILLDPWQKTHGKGKWKDKEWDMYRLAPQHKDRIAGNAPAAPADEAFAQYGGDHDVYRPGGKSRGQRANAYRTEDSWRIMNGGNQVEPYAYEPVLELTNTLVAGKFDPAVKFEHNVKAKSADMKVIEEIRKFNKAWDKKFNLGAKKEKKAAPSKGGDTKAS